MNDENIPTTETLAENPDRRRLILVLSGVVIVGVCALFILISLWFQIGQPSLFPTSTPLHQAPSPANLTATQQAWVKPKESPTLASAEDVRKASEDGSTPMLLSMMVNSHRVGNLTIWEVELFESIPLTWSEGRCASTLEMLDENFKHMQFDFIVNGSHISTQNLAIRDFGLNGRICRGYTALVETWPSGIHHLEFHVTFTQTINNGLDTFPAGTGFITKYIVTVHP